MTQRNPIPTVAPQSRWFWCVFSLACLWTVTAVGGITISGQVFYDRNQNGVRDAREPGLARVAVSDGHQVVVTSKQGDYTLETEPGRLVFVSLPKGYRMIQSFYARVDATTNLSFPLVAWPASRKSALRFVQISDTHVTEKEDAVQTFAEDIAEINTLVPPAAFALASGDLVDVGTKTNQFENYRRSIANFKIPLFNLPGNHDVQSGQGLAHYHHYLGPNYYSFNAGDCHFVLLDSVRFDQPAQQQWIARDLAAAPPGATLIFAFHFLPTQKQLEYLADLGAAAIISGHWHGNRVRESHGVLDINTPPLRFGGIDRHPRSFRIVDVQQGKLDLELRLGGFNHHCVVVTPSGTVHPESGKIPVVVNTYDSRCEIKSVRAQIGQRRARLQQVSPWTWTGTIPAPGLAGAQLLTIHVQGGNGKTWEQAESFNLADGMQPVAPGPHWRLKWVAPTGGFIGISSPQAGWRHLAVGVDDRGDLKHCGVAAFDRNGKKQWHFKTDSGIKHNVAAADGRFFATSVAGWLYALDEDSGKLLWKAELDRTRERWEVAATTVAHGTVYVGRRSYIAAFEAATGKRLWEASAGKSDWWPSSYTIPTVAGDKLLLFSNVGALALNAATGQTVWTAKGWFNGCLATEAMIYTLKDGLLTGLSPADGTVVWSCTPKIGDTASVPARADGKIIVGTATGDILALAETNGDVLWTFKTSPVLSSLQPYQRGGRDVNSSPAIHRGKIFTGASDGFVYALALATGEKLAEFQVGVPIASSPLIHEETLYIGGYDGNLYAFVMPE